jgi:hypothetical protein
MTLGITVAATQFILTSTVDIHHHPELSDGMGKMKNVISVVGGIGLSLILVSAASAASFEESMSRCLSRNANNRDAATVMLDCNAEGGKLSACKVVSDSAPGKGFDKAALCVAEVLPIGAKTGQVKVPLRFPGGG